MIGLILFGAVLPVLVLAVWCLVWLAADRRQSRIDRKDLALIASHIEAQQPARRPELRVINGGRRNG